MLQTLILENIGSLAGVQQVQDTCDIKKRSRISLIKQGLYKMQEFSNLVLRDLEQVQAQQLLVSCVFTMVGQCSSSQGAHTWLQSPSCQHNTCYSTQSLLDCHDTLTSRAQSKHPDCRKMEVKLTSCFAQAQRAYYMWPDAKSKSRPEMKTLVQPTKIAL